MKRKLKFNIFYNDDGEDIGYLLLEAILNYLKNKEIGLHMD